MVSAQWVALFICFVAYVRQASCSTAQSGSADSLLSKLYFTTHPTGKVCSSLLESGITTDDENCDGGLERLFTHDGAYNIIPQQDDVGHSISEYTNLRYDGTLANGAFISLVDNTLSLDSNNPCSPVEAGHTPDQLHSGIMKGTTDGLDGSSDGNVIRLKQNNSGVLLQATKNFAVCYTTGTGNTTDPGWTYANMVVRTSRLSRLDIYDKKFRSCGAGESSGGPSERPCVIPNHPSLVIRYYGTIDNDKWVSLVDSTLSLGDPCNDPVEAAGYKDSRHSGSRTSAGNVFTVDTAGLDASKTFAVCYSENGGIKSSLWRDAGLRLRRSQITSVEYGVDTVRLGDGVKYSAWNRNNDDNDLVPTDRLPRRAATTKIGYTGELNAAAFVSLVDATLGNGQPCMYPQIAGAAQDGLHSGASNQATASIVDLDFGTAMLDLVDGNGDLRVYAVCYSTVDGSSTDYTWSDSYVRYSMSNLESVQHHMAIHATRGMLPYEAALEMSFNGDMDVNGGSNQIALVLDLTAGSEVTNAKGFLSYQPCQQGFVTASSSASAPGYSGTSDAATDGNDGTKRVVIDTTQLETGDIITLNGAETFATGDPILAGTWGGFGTSNLGRVTHMYAVCYSDTNDGHTSAFLDSGIRLTISKMSKITHGTTTSPMVPYDFFPGTAASLLPATGKFLARQVLPTTTNEEVVYYAAPTHGTALGTNRYLSIVKSTINSNKPCLLSETAGAAADSDHSGSIQAAGSDVTIPQGVPLDDGETFAVCYAFTSGTTADPSWHDSYIRLTVSDVAAVESLGITHKVNDYIQTIAARDAISTYNNFYYKEQSASRLPIVYSGTLAASGYLSLVDDTLGSKTNFPCADDATAIGQSGVTGKAPVQAGTLNADSTSTVLFDTASLDYTKLYAICYSESATSNFRDTGIRVKRSAMDSIQFNSGYANPRPREMTSVEYDTNRIPAVDSSAFTALELGYVGVHDPASGSMTLSLVATDVALVNGNPCITVTGGATQDSQHTGDLTVTGTPGSYCPSSIGTHNSAYCAPMADVTNADSLTTTTSFAVCYKAVGGSADTLCGGAECWSDSYIRLTVTELGYLEHHVGRYTDSTYTPGRLIRHRTSGHLPAVGDVGSVTGGFNYDLMYKGSLSATAQVSFVAADWGTTVENDVTYQRPCQAAYASRSAATYPTETTGVLTAAGTDGAGGSGTIGTIQTFVSANLNAQKIYALCYSTDSFATDSHDSGLRFTISKIQDMIFDGDTTDHNHSPSRSNTPLFLSTNRIPAWSNRQFRYVGHSDILGKYVSFVEDSENPGATSNDGTGSIDGTGNPCVTWSGASGSQSTTKSGPITFAPKRSCTTYGEKRLTAGTLINAYTGVTSWQTCRDYCEADSTCMQVVYNRATQTCDTDSTSPNSEDSSDYTNTVYGAGLYVSAICTSASANDVAMVPQDANILDAGTDGMKTYAICYSEYEAEQASNGAWVAAGADEYTTTASTGASTSIWHDSYIRVRVSNLAFLETSQISSWTYGHVPIIGTPVAYDYFSSSKAHQFIWNGQAAADQYISLVNEVLNNYYPCTQTHTDTNHGIDNEHSGNSDTDGVNQMLDTTELDTEKQFAVCVFDNLNAMYFDSGIRVTVSKVRAVEFSSGQIGSAVAPAAAGSANSVHDAVDQRVMTTKATMTNRLPRAASQVLKMIPSLDTDGMAGTTQLSLVRSTRNNGNPCVLASETEATADSEHSGAVTASLLSVTLDASGLGAGNPDWKFKVCYKSNTGAAANEWRDSFIILAMSDITSLNVHLPVLTGLDSSVESTVEIRTVGQIPSQRASQTVQYSITGGLSSGGYITLVDEQRGLVSADETVAGTNSLPFSESGYTRYDPCDALKHADQAPTDVATWTSALVGWDTTAAKHTHGTVDSDGRIRNMDTTLLSPTRLYAVCYSSDGTGWYDSGVRATVPQVTGLQYRDVQLREDRTRQITSVTKTYNVLPLSSSVDLTYVGMYEGLTLSFVAHTENNYNPCVHDTVAETNTPNTGSDGSGGDGRMITQAALTTDTMYAVCYAVNVVSSTNEPWIRAKPAAQSTWRDSYIRILATEIEKVTSYKVDSNIRGQLPSHPELKLDYTGGLASGARIALVDESLNAMTVGTTTSTHTFPCYDNSGTNVDSPTSDPASTSCASTSTCTHSGAKTAIGKGVTMDTTDLHTQAVYVVCYNSHATDNTKWRDSGIRLTLPEIIALSLPSDHVGTPSRVYKSWDTVDGSTILDRPTSRLPAYDGITLGFFKHPSTPNNRAATAQFSLVRVNPHARHNPCPEFDGTTHEAAQPDSTCSSDDCTATGSISGGSTSNPFLSTATGEFTVTQSTNQKLSRESGDHEDGTFAVCYISASSNDGSISSDMYEVPASHTTGNEFNSDTSSFLVNTVYWEDTFIRLKISAVESLTASGVTHRTTGQVPNTAAESVTTWGLLDGRQTDYPFGFAFNLDAGYTTMTDGHFVTLVDASLNPQANGEGVPCVGASAGWGTSDTPSGDCTGSTCLQGDGGGDATGLVTGWNTMQLDPTTVYALCYATGDASTSDNTWSDSGIRITVPAVHAVLFDSGHAGPGNKEDTRARPMTSVILPTNTFPRKSTADLTYVGTLAANKYISLVDVSTSPTDNPCVDGLSHTAPITGSDTAATTGSHQAGANSKQVSILQAANELLEGGSRMYAVCYDGSSTAPTFTHSPECDCDLETNAAARATCLATCTSSLETNAGGVSSISWRDSYIRLRITQVYGLRVHHGVTTDTSTRRSIDIVTVGGIPATAVEATSGELDARQLLPVSSTVLGGDFDGQVYNRQVGFEYLGSLSAFDGTNSVVMLVDEERTQASADNTNIIHRAPCSTAASLDSIGADPSTDATSAYTATTSAESGQTEIVKMVTNMLDTRKKFALCYSHTDGSSASDWYDSGLRLTVAKIQSMHYLGDVPYDTVNTMVTEQELLNLRNRKMTASKTALSVIPREADVKLRWDHPGVVWPNERALSSDAANEVLAAGQAVSLVSVTLNSGNPCVNPAVASAAASSAGTSNSRLHSGVMTGTGFDGTGTGSWITVPMGNGNLLAKASTSNEYAVCYAEGTGDGSDITWRDSFIRIDTSEITGLQQFIRSEDNQWQSFGTEWKTTGHLGDSALLKVTISGELASLSNTNVALVESTTGSQRERTDLDYFDFPCNTNAPASSGDRQTGSLTSSSGTFSVDTTSLHRKVNTDEEVIYALCYQDGSSDWSDSAIRLTLTQVQQILYKNGYDRGTAPSTLALTSSSTAAGDGGSVVANGWSGCSSAYGMGTLCDYFDYVWGVDTKKDTMARHIDSAYSVKNRLPLHTSSAPASRFTDLSYVSVPNSRMGGTLGQTKRIAFVAESKGTQWASPCDMYSVAGGNSVIGNTISGYMEAGANDKYFTFDSQYLTNNEKYAVCYTDDYTTDDNSLNRWRDSYIRFKFTALTSITALEVEHSVFGQIPNAKASEQLKLEYMGTLADSMFISLVDQTLNTNVPCDLASTAADCADSVSCPTVVGRYSGVVQADKHTKTITSLDTTGLDPDKEFALCYSTDGSAFEDSGVRLTVPKLHTVTAPFDNDFADPCRGTSSCTTPDRPMTSYPLATNRLPRFDSQMLEYTAYPRGAADNFIAIVDASLNDFNPCVDPSIPGTASVTNNFDTTGTTASNTRQLIQATQAVAGKVDLTQDPTNLIASATSTTLPLGNEYAVCYSDGDGSDSDLNWRDSYIRLKPDEIVGFGTKGVTHYTQGQIPHHRGTNPQGYTIDGLTFDYWMSADSPMVGDNYITLAKASPTWGTPSSGSVDATVSVGNLDTVVFTGTADTTNTAQTDVVVGNQIMIGQEIRTVVYVDGATETATVSPAFGQAYADQEFFVLVNTQRFDGGFAKYTYSPCDVASDAAKFDASTTTEFIDRVQALTGSTSGDTHTRSVIDLSTTSMIANEEYALCYSATVGSDEQWHDSGIRVEVSALSAIEFSGHQRGVTGFPTAYNVGYEDMGLGECTGTTINDVYYYDSRMDEARCINKCNLYTDCLGYSASSIPVEGYAVRSLHCKLWRAADSASEIAAADSANTWGDSHCMRKTSGSDEITRGKSHRKLQSVVANLQPHPEVSSNVLPINQTISLVYAGELAKSSYLSIVALTSSNNGLTTGMNPCRDAATAATASSTSSGAQRACHSPGAGYVTPQMYAQGGGECKPSGEVCADVHASIMATLHATGCPNTDKSVVRPALMASYDTAFASTSSQPATAVSPLNQLCAVVAAGSSTWEEQVACCGDTGSACTPTCTTVSAIPDCSHSVDYQGNKEVSFSMATALDMNADGYTICYTDGDGSATDTNWRDSYVRVQLSKVTSIIATGVTHTDHGHLANHDDQTPLEIEYAGSQSAIGYYISLVDETYNDNNPCVDANYADGTSTADASHFSVSTTAGDSNQKVQMKTSHMDTTKQYAVCYNEGSAPWFDSGIRVRITELTNIRYNEAQEGGATLNSVGMYTRDMTSSRVKISPDSTYFVDDPAAYDGLMDSRDITSTHTIPAVFSGTLDLSFRGDLVQGSALALVEVTQNFGDPCVLGSTVSQPAGTGQYFYSSSPGVFYFDDASGVYGTNVATTSGFDFSFTAAMIAGLDSTKTYTLCYDPRTSGAGDSQNPAEQNSLYGWYDAAAIAQDWNMSPAYDHPISGNFDGLGTPMIGWRDSYIRFTISRIDFATSHLMEHRVQGHIANAQNYDLSFKGTLPVGSTIALVDSTVNSLVPCVASEAAQAGGSSTPNTNDRSGPITSVDFVDGATTGASSISIDSNLLDTTLNYAVCYSDGTTQSSDASVSNPGSTWYDSGIRVRVSKVVSLHYNREQQTEVATEVYMRTWLSTNKANGATNDYPVVTNRLPLVGSSGPTYDLQYRGFLASGATFSLVHASAFIREPCASVFVAGHVSDTEHYLASAATSSDFTVDTSQYLDGMAFDSASGQFGSSGAIVAVCYLDETASNDMWKDSHIRLHTSKIHYFGSYGVMHQTTGMISNKASLRVTTVGTLAAAGDILTLVEENVNNERPCDASEASKASSADVTLYSGISTANSNTANAHTLDTSSLSTGKIFALCYAEGDGSSSDTSWEDSGIRLRTPKVTSVTYSQPARVITSASCFDGDLFGVADCNPSKTCSGNSCSGGDPSVLCAADATESCTVLPRHDGAASAGVALTIDGPDASGTTFVSLVRQDLGVQTNNPCRDARQANAAANSAGSANARQHSGPLAVTNGAFTLPQLNDVNNVTNLLQYDGTFAVCYSEGDGSDTDATWRDSYVRITLSKIENVQASDMVVTTRGMFANVPSLRVTWTGSLGWKKWINLVEVTANSGVPCNKAFAESYEQCGEGCEFDASGSAFIAATTTELSAEECRITCINTGTCAAYTYVGGTCNTFDNTAYSAGGMVHNQPSSYSGVMDGVFPQTGWLQAGAASEMVDFDTTALTADALYTVCYADEAGTPATGGPSGGAEWTDSGLRLRFIKWDNSQKSRVASGAATLMRFSINHQDIHGNFFDTTNDRFALLKGAADCTGAPAAPLLSDGTTAKRVITIGWSNSTNDKGFDMPSGTGAAERATAWRQCHPMLYGPTRIDYDNYETCDEPGQYQDTNLEEGTYIVCFCDSDNGNSGCDHANEWIKLSSSGTDPDMLKVVQTPRLGRAYDAFSSTSHVGSVRGVSGASHTYNIKSTETSGLEVNNLDKVFFKDTFCDSIPGADTSTETAPIDVSGYDADSNSGTYKAGRVITPSTTPLTSLGANPRPLVTCYATQESLAGTTEARDYVQLQDGLEIIDRPRLGTNMHGAPDGVVRSLSGNSPIFEAVSLRDGDRLFFKEMTTYNWQLTGTLGIGSDVCDYTTNERCSCDSSGVLSCSNAAHECTGMSCTQDYAEGADADCQSGTVDVYGAITSVIPAGNSVSGTTLINGQTFQDEDAAGMITTFQVALNADGFTNPIHVAETADDVPYLSHQTADFKFAVDGATRPLLSASMGNTYIFDLSSQTLNENPFVLSLKEGGTHNEGDVYSTGVTYYLDGIERALPDYLTYFVSAQTRSITFTPTEADILYYHSYSTENLGAQITVYRDDSGTFQLPTDVPLTSVSATVPRFLSACFIPAGAIESLHTGNNCSYYNPTDATCTQNLINAHRLEDYLQVLPEPTDALKTSHNHSKIYNLNFNEPQFGTFWRTTNHWCESSDELNRPCGVRSTDRGFGGNSTSLCCVSPPNFASGAPGDVIVLKKEDTPGSGDCNGVELITDEDYLVGSQYTRKMTLTTLDTDHTSQSESARPDLVNGGAAFDYRAVSMKGAGVSHHSIADGKVNELEEGYYTICYATAESGADDNADFVKLAKSIEILPSTATGPSMTVPATVLLGHNINIKWASTSGYQEVSSEPHSWVGLFRAGECANDSGEDQNKCYLASETVDLAVQPGEGTITFSATDYKLTAGSYEIRYFEGTSRDGHGAICRGMEGVGRDSYINCLLESVYTSEEITVFADVNSLDDLSAIPGLEMAFEGEISRFSGKGAGLPGSKNDGFGFKRK